MPRLSGGFSKPIISLGKKKRLKRKTNPSLFNFYSSASQDKGDHLWPEEQRVHPKHHSRGTFPSGTGSGPPARCHPSVQEEPQTPLPWPDGSQQGSPLGFGGQGAHQALLGAEPGTDGRCHRSAPRAPGSLLATGIVLADSRQGHGGCARVGTSLGTGQREGSGERPRTRGTAEQNCRLEQAGV